MSVISPCAYHYCNINAKTEVIDLVEDIQKDYGSYLFTAKRRYTQISSIQAWLSQQVEYRYSISWHKQEFLTCKWYVQLEMHSCKPYINNQLMVNEVMYLAQALICRPALAWESHSVFSGWVGWAMNFTHPKYTESLSQARPVQFWGL